MSTQAASAASYTQSGRPIAVKTTLGDDALLLVAITGEEEVSQPFRYTLELLSTDAAVDGAALLRTPASVRVALRDGEERLIQGRISRFVQLGREDDVTRYAAELVPAIWFLSLSRDYRVFADKTVQQIVTTVLEDAGLAEGDDFAFSLLGEYAPVRYAIQYRESHLDFVSRLLEDAGIFYFFEHSDRGHKLVMTDVNATAEYGPGTQPVRVRPADTREGVDEDESLTLVERELQARPGKIAIADYNFRTPSSHLLNSLAGAHPEEVYEYPARFRDMRQGDTVARVRLEEQEAGGLVVRGSGPCRVIRAGGRFDLADHYRPELNKTYLALRVALDIRLRGFRSGEEASLTYAAELTAIPFDVPFRPARVTPAPRIPGVQTAMVGPAPGGEEILVDKYGRIPVQFHWDRRGKEANEPSVWARVATMWAGKSWGSVSIPRIGQEVVVEFLEGDPDRPLVIGSVYNAEQMPPQGLPGAGMVSGFKSNSTPGGGGYNEISADDSKGKEKVTIHAQYDMGTTVQHDQTNTINNNRTTNVAVDDSETIGSNQTISVGADQSITVGSNRSLSVGSNDTNTVGADQSNTIGSNQTNNVGSNRTTNVGSNNELNVGANLAIVAGAKITAEAGANVEVTATGNVKVSGTQIEISGMAKITLSAGGSTIEIGPSGITIQTAALVNVQGATIKLN